MWTRWRAKVYTALSNPRVARAIWSVALVLVALAAPTPLGSSSSWGCSYC